MEWERSSAHLGRTGTAQTNYGTSKMVEAITGPSPVLLSSTHLYDGCDCSLHAGQYVGYSSFINIELLDDGGLDCFLLKVSCVCSYQLCRRPTFLPPTIADVHGSITVQLAVFRKLKLLFSR